jgi:predicted Zn-dependent protease
MRARVVLTLAILLVVAPGADAQVFDRVLKGVEKGAEKAEKVQKAMAPMTLEEERALGRDVAAKLIAHFGLYEDEALLRYVNLVGAAVAQQAERKDLTYHFAILNSDDINAFSAPGGYIFITRGALALCGDEAELAGVLAHEVGHIAGRHILRIIERDKGLRAGMDEAKAYVPGSERLHKMSRGVLVKMIDQGLAPSDEFDADRRALRYAHAAGYPADGLAGFLTKLDEATEQGGQSFWTRTHPPVEERNARIAETIEDREWQDADRPRLVERYAAETQAVRPKPGV